MEEWHRKQALYEEGNTHQCLLRRPRFFPLCLNDLGDVNDPSTEHYKGWDEGYITPSVHWTFLVEVVTYQHQNFVGRPEIRCKDIEGTEFNVTGYFEECGRRNRWFDTRVAPNIKPGYVLAIRYAESKQFMDMSTGIRLEDDHVEFVKMFPCSLEQLLGAADTFFRMKSKTPVLCWAGCEEKGANLSRCSRCKTALYCSKSCQSDHWKASHKHNCKLIEAVKELAGLGNLPFELENFDKTKWVKFL